MRRPRLALIQVLSLVGVVVAPALALTSSAGATTSTPTISLSAITATFQSAQFATHYNVHAADTAGHALTYRWTLKLQLIDAAGSANPSSPGSRAAIDPACNNQGKLTSSAIEFIWRHGDGSLGGCDHSKMGPSGHQGRVTIVVSDTKWSCTATYGGTNSGTGPAATCQQLKPLPPKFSAARYRCQGTVRKIFDNSNGGGVQGNGRPPSFNTKNIAYCVVQLITYHWNAGAGASPGTIGLGGINGTVVGRWRAKGSSGQGAAPNVNWIANVSTSPNPVVIKGVYSCIDSQPSSWSQDVQTHGTGFCQVYVQRAVTATGATGTKKTPTTTVKSTAAAKCKGSKLTLTATPDTGKPALNVIFAICSPKSVQWRIDFGDGKSKVAMGTPPRTLQHTYSREGDFRPTLRTIGSQSGSAASIVATSVSVHFAQLISLSANPPSGAAPLHVSFGLATTVKNVTTWTLDFGDGTRTGGAGSPARAVTHTYASNGSYRATFAVKPGAYALVFSVAQIVVGTGAPPVLGLSATPNSGSHPLSVRFAIGTTIPGVISSWVLKFGDGAQQSGQGKPPSSSNHTYARKGVFLAYLIVAQQQQYGGVQYIVPRSGLMIQVG